MHIMPGLGMLSVIVCMDDPTLTMTMACTQRLLKKLQDNIEMAQLKIKPSASRRISIVKGKQAHPRFYIKQVP